MDNKKDLQSKPRAHLYARLVATPAQPQHKADGEKTNAARVQTARNDKAGKK